jgi:hypothetical protein
VRRAPLAAAVFFAAVAAFAADPEPKTMKANFVGEGGGYKPADTTTEGYMVGPQTPPSNANTPAAAALGPGIPAAGVASLPGVAPSDPAAPTSAPAPRSASPGIDAPSRSTAARPAASERNASIPGEAKSAGRQSLWNGLVQPLAMTASEAAAAADPDTDRANADRDYETHILGMKSAPARPALANRPMSASAAQISVASAASARAAGGKVFVSLAIDPREAGSLRDAVAGLGAAAGFSADARSRRCPAPTAPSCTAAGFRPDASATRWRGRASRACAWRRARGPRTRARRAASS